MGGGVRVGGAALAGGVCRAVCWRGESSWLEYGVELLLDGVLDGATGLDELRELGDPVGGVAGRGAAGAGRSGDDGAGCGRKLAVERGGESGGALLTGLTGGFVAGRTAGAADGGAAEAVGETGGDKPGVVGRPVPPPLAMARAAALSATPDPTGRVAPGPAVLTGRGGSAGRDGEEPAAGREAEDGGADGTDADRGEGPEVARGGAVDARPLPPPDGPAVDAEPDDAGGAGGTEDGGVADFETGAGAAGPGDVVTVGRAGAGRTRLVTSSPAVDFPDLPDEESPGSLDFTSVASVVIGFAPPPC